MAKGNFSVKSTYKVAFSSSSNSIGGTSDGHNNKWFWISLWWLNIPNKVKSFTWRASKNIHPTKANLCHRKVLDNPTCKVCGLEAKSTVHLFWHCKKSQEVWSLAGLPIDLHGLRFQEFVDFLWHLKFVQHMGNDVLELAITIAWSIWFNRNTTRLGKSSQNASMHNIQKERVLLNEFQVANFQTSRPVVRGSGGQWICLKPP